MEQENVLKYHLLVKCRKYYNGILFLNKGNSVFYRGETALSFYRATNKSDKYIIYITAYSITPGEAPQNFDKDSMFLF